MKRNHLLNQPRPVLESKILKHISGLSFANKINKYEFLSIRYELL